MTGLKTAPSSSSRSKGRSLGGPAAASIDSVDLNASSESDDQFPTNSRPQQKQKHRTSNARKAEAKRFQGMLSKNTTATASSSKNKSSKATSSEASSSRTAQIPSVFQPAQLEDNSCQDYGCADSSEDENRHANHKIPGPKGSSSARFNKEDRGYSSIESSSFRSSQSSQEVGGGKSAAKKLKTPKGQGRGRSLGSSSARTSTGSMQLSFQEVPRSGVRID
jgi:hypothetical protein